MSGQGEAGALQRAHALSAQASQVLHNPSPSLATLNSALESYREAAELFSQASSGSKADPGTLKTLQLLTAQHRKLVRDLERRISLSSNTTSAAHPSLRRAATVPAPSAGTSSAVSSGRLSTERRPTSPIKRPNEPAGLAAIGVSPSPFFASSTAAPRQIPSSRALPPFAQRPLPPSITLSGQRATSRSQRPPPSLSPLYSSASSSDPDPAESYITFGLGLGSEPGDHGGKEIDQFSRFWGRLEECLETVSRPMAFASAPLGSVPPKSPHEEVERLGGTARLVRDKDEARGLDIQRTASPSDSYYMIAPESASISTSAKERRTSASTKTPEELILENESLRASLDALAVHAQQVDRENQELKQRSQEREAVLRTVAAEVRKEAEKARLDTSVPLRSQIFSGESSSRQNGGERRETRDPNEGDVARKLKLRVDELEREVKELRGENEKQKASIVKYKDRFEKIKSTARAKRDARSGGGDELGRQNG